MNGGHLSLLLGFLLSFTACYICLEEEKNVAVNMTAVQSSTAYDGHPSRAVDGRRDSDYYNQHSCSHTEWEQRPWWRVDLLYPHKISSVAVTRRADCCSTSINGTEIRIGNSLTDNGNSNPMCAQIVSMPAGATITYQCQGMIGRYVSLTVNRTDYLQLCEVEVYGRALHEEIDECADDPSICGPNAVCTNTPGTHNCTCHSGYRVMKSGFRANASNPCEEIDECADDPSICGPNAVCTNTPGTHNCTCHSGYRVMKSGFRANASNPCEEIDECEDDCSICGPNTVCINTPGSYSCTCKHGYISSAGLSWKAGDGVCNSTQELLASAEPPEGQTREMFFLSTIKMDLDNNPDIVLSEKAVTAVLNTTMSITDEISPGEETDGQAETANVVLNILEGLVSALVDPESQKNNTETLGIVTPHIEMNIMSIKGNMTGKSELAAKGNMMEINLAAVAKNNNGSAAAVLMSVSGVEKFMSPSFFESENVTEMYSDIIIATLLKTKNMELPEPVNFTMSNKKVKMFQAGMVTCVYWEERGRETHWSVEGCTASFSNETHTVCSCTHLSTFAILLQTEKQEEDDPLLEKVNLFCVCVGLTFLALAILTFLLCPWNPKINNTARLHLSICLFLGHLLLLVGESRTENTVVCAVIAGTLQFLFLSSFVWMMLETLQLFLLVRSLAKVQVIQKDGLKALYLLPIGYGTPMVVVGVSAALFSDGYGSKDSCWLSKERSFHWSFKGPVAYILTLNLVSFCVILWILQPTLAHMKSEISTLRDTRLIIFKIVAQFFVLGCAWILGFFQGSAMLKYLFIILNSQQGTFIFIVHCLLNKEVRVQYKRWFSCLFRTKEPSGRNDSTNTLSTVQQ